MAVDLTIQLFAYDLFNALRSHFFSKWRPYPDSTIPDGTIVEKHINTEMVYAVICRQVVFREIYNYQFRYTGIACCDSPSDFLSHLVVAFNDKAFRDLKVFDRLIATCAFVMEMSLYCYTEGNKRFLRDDYQCWAMYFDTELKSTFYEQGGWNVLKSVAKSYALPLSAINMLSRTYFLLHVHLEKFATGMDDFYYYQKFQDQGNQTCAKSWVNFRIKNAKNPTGNTFNYSTVEGIEDILMCFKFLCDPLGERISEADFRRRKENFLTKFKGNEFLENLATKVSKSHPSYPTEEDCSFHDGLAISPPSEVFQGPTDAVQALTDAAQAQKMQMQALKIERLSNSKLIDHASTQKTTFHTNNLLNDSPVDNINFSKCDVSEDQEKRLRTQEIETNNCLDTDTAVHQDRKLQTQDSETNNGLNNVTVSDQDRKLQTQDSITNNCLNNDTATGQDQKLQTKDSETNNCLNNVTVIDQDRKLQTQESETNNCLNNDTETDQDRKLQTQESETNNCLNNDTVIDQDQILQGVRTEKNNLLEDGTSVQQNSEKNTKSKMEIFKTYEDMKILMQRTSINEVLSHVSVFLDDHSIIHTEKEFAVNANLHVRENSNVFAVGNETSRRITDASLEGQEIKNDTKNKKKKRKTKAGKVATDEPKRKTYTDDTQDILKMALVLGCQPGVNYIRSTLTKSL